MKGANSLLICVEVFNLSPEMRYIAKGRKYYLLS